MSDEQHNPRGEHPCPRCGTLFSCGLQAEQPSCWCFAFPHLFTAENAPRFGCVCSNCLTQLLEQVQQENPDG